MPKYAILLGFAIAGAVATLVPDAVFQAIFPQELPLLLLMLVHPLLGPVRAMTTVISSMGNGPLAAVLRENGVLFGGILAFLYADFVVIPSNQCRLLRLRFTAYLAIVFAASAAGAGLALHAIFRLLRLIPEREAGRVQELAQFEMNYVFFLNVAAIVVILVLVWLKRGGAGRTTMSDGFEPRIRGLTYLPEFNIVVFAILLNWPWEFLQVPFFSGMPLMMHWEGIKACTRAALADAVIMLFAYGCVAVFAGRFWVLHLKLAHVAAFIGVGLVLTVIIEKMALSGAWIESWSYSERMWVLPVLDVGLAPVLQWILLPLIVIWFCRRQLRACG